MAATGFLLSPPRRGLDLPSAGQIFLAPPGCPSGLQPDHPYPGLSAGHLLGARG